MSILLIVTILTSVFVLLTLLGILYMLKYRKHFAFNSIKREADNGKKDAMMLLGYIYYTGSNHQKQDVTKAIDYFQRAVDAGSDQASYLLGGIYVEGKAIMQDIDKGVTLIKSAADSGNILAQRSMANLLADGSLIERNSAESVKYFMLAAANGDMISQKTIAGIYQFTKEFDRKIAYAWYCLAADQQDKYSAEMAEKLLHEFADDEKIVAINMADEYRLKFGKNTKLN